MQEIKKADALTQADRYDAVYEFFVLHYQYPSANAELDNSWRVFNYYNEMASGGYEGYLAWTVGHLHANAIQDFYNALIQQLEGIGAQPLAHIEGRHGVGLWHLSRAFENGEISEDAYCDAFQPINQVYFDYEDTFREQMIQYAEKIFPQLFEIKE